MFNAIVVIAIAMVLILAGGLAMLMCKETYDENLVEWNGQK